MSNGHTMSRGRKKIKNTKDIKHSKNSANYARKGLSHEVRRIKPAKPSMHPVPNNNRSKTYSYRSRRKVLNKKDDKVIFLNTKTKQMDLSLMLIVFMLVMFGLIMIFSSSFYIAIINEKFDNDALYFLKKQGMWAVLGTVSLFMTANIDYRIFRIYSGIIYAIANFFLILVLIIGDEINGSKRWLVLGPIEFQPSEVAKIATILFLALYISENRDILKNVTGFIKCMMIVIIPVILIAIENFSTAVVVAGVGTAMIFAASPVIWYFVAMAVPAVGGAVIAISLPMFAYRFDRIKAWQDPFADTKGIGFQTVQSLYAVASGGIFGLGLGHSRQKLGYIPEAYNDIIFSIVCEELGLFGASALILLFYALIYKGITVALKCPDMFGSLIACGITCMIAVQVIINIAVNTNTMPVTGMPLPFISYGGSSLMIMMSCMGVLLNISRYTRD